MKTLALLLEYQYEKETFTDTARIAVDPKFPGESWQEAVMLIAADDCCMGPADPGELELMFHDRDMGVVVYYDKLVDNIVTVYAEEKQQ